MGEGLDGDEEVIWGWDPTFSGGIESPAFDHEVKVGVELKILIPGVQDGGAAYLSIEPVIPLGQFLKSLGGCLE